MENTKKKLPLSWLMKLATTILCVVAGLVLIGVLGDIYFTGEESGLSHVYSYETVAARGGLIITSLVIFVVSFITSLVLHFVFKDKEKRKAKRDIYHQYQIMKSKKDLSLLEDKNQTLFQKNENTLLIINIIAVILSALLLIFPFAYVFNGKNFDAHGDLLLQAIALGIHVLPFLFVIYILWIIALSYKERVMDSTISLLTKLKMKEEMEVKVENALVINIIRGVIFLTAISFIIIGALSGEVSEVLNKAINICTECIGLG